MVLYIKFALNMRDTNTTAEKYFKSLQMYLYLEFTTWAKESRLCVQSLNTTCLNIKSA
jgi:hypothetical protein